MTIGIEIYNANGTLQFSIVNRVVRMLTVQATGTSNGSVNVPGASSKGTLLPVVMPTATGLVPPTASVSGDTLSWSFGSTPTGSRRASNIALVQY